LRIILGHNFYSSSTPSGENQVFEDEKRLLHKNSHELQFFTRHSDELKEKGPLGVLHGALSVPWNPWMVTAIKDAVETFKPQIVHIHNTFPLISPAIFHAIGHRSARVLTLHNYRLFCPAAIPMRQGQVCTECLDKGSVIPSLLHGCYRGSRLATLPLAFGVELHRALGTWKNEVDAFIALSDFQRELMIEAGLPEKKVHVKPNFYPGSPEIVPWSERQPYVLFAGRLTAEKGVINLLRAWQAWGSSAPELRLAGDGELRLELERMARGLPVRFLGQLSAAATVEQIANARLQILPSEWFEGFPMVVREAFAFGTPSAVSKIGPLPSIVEHGKSGILFQPCNPQSLLHEVRSAWESTELLEELGRGARNEFEMKYTEKANHDTLMAIYQSAIQVSSHG